MPAPIDERRQRHARPAAAHGTTRPRPWDRTARRQREQVDPERLDVDGGPAHRLRRVAVQQNAAFARQRRNSGDGLQHPDLVVGQHDADQHRVGGERPLDRRRADEAIRTRLHLGQPGPAVRQPAARVEHRPMLGCHSHDVQRSPAARGQRALQRQVVRLGGAAREADFARVRADQTGHLPARRPARSREAANGRTERPVALAPAGGGSPRAVAARPGPHAPARRW